MTGTTLLEDGMADIMDVMSLMESTIVSSRHEGLMALDIVLSVT